jgi:hypothetical protein
MSRPASVQAVGGIAMIMLLVFSAGALASDCYQCVGWPDPTPEDPDRWYLYCESSIPEYGNSWCADTAGACASEDPCDKEPPGDCFPWMPGYPNCEPGGGGGFAQSSAPVGAGHLAANAFGSSPFLLAIPRVALGRSCSAVRGRIPSVAALEGAVRRSWTI